MNSEPEVGPKPAEGFSGKDAFDNRLYQYDETGRIKSSIGYVSPAFDKTSGASLTNPSARIGDYVIQNGKPVPVPNSPTDLAQKYKIAIGGSGLSSQEAVGQAFDLPSVAGGAAAGAAIGSILPGPGTAVGVLIGGLAGALNAYNTNAEDALKKWQEQNIKYDTAVEFYRDDDGVLRYKLDYQKMGTGGPYSGEGVKEAQNRETQVSLGDDGRLKITVSPIFASTARFQELVNWISENYAGLTKDTENYEQILKEIRDGIDGEARDYITNMKLYADYTNRFPNASPEAIVSAYMTEVAGYVDPEKMSEFTMTIVGDNGLEVQTAATFFDSVYKMDKNERNQLIAKLNDIVYGDNDYGDNEKAVAFGEIKALYAVSQNSEGYKNDKYQGMLDADFMVTLVSSFSPLGLNAGDVLHFVSGGNLIKTKQEFLNQNDLARFTGMVGSVGASLGLFKGATSLIEKGMKLLPGTAQLFNASLEGQEGGALAFFAQNTGNTAAVAKAASASAAFKTLKVGIFDAALAGSKTLVSGTDFWSEFGQDFARDAILEAVFSYYDAVQFQKAVNESVTYVYRDPKTGDIKTLPNLEESVFVDTPISETLVEKPVYDSNGNRVGTEWLVKTEGGLSKYEPVGAASLQQTRAGEEVGIIQSEYGITYYYNGTAVTVSPTGEVQKMLAAPEGMTDGIPVLKTGVAEEADVATTELTTVEQTLERMGLPKDAEIFTLPSQSAAAAEVAGKIAKLDTTKVGLAINTKLFNKNAALDIVNEIALAKTGDLTAWQNRSQKFVSVLDNANQEINLMRTGSYVKSSEQAFNDYQLSLGALNLTQKYKKTDANFLKAITQLERAAYLDRHKVEGDTRNYTAEALEKYGDAIAKVPDDRAAVLRDFNEKRKAHHDATKASARKSGKIDIKKLDSFTDSDLQKEIGWVPQWGKKQTYNGLLNKYYGISQERNIYKEWLPEGGWVDLDVLEDPIKADERFLNFVATNMGITDMIENTASALDDARMLVDNTPTSETIRKRKLDSIKNKDELTKKLSDMIAEKKKEIKEKVLDQKQYKELMQKNIEESGVLDAIEDVIAGDTTMQAVIGTSEVLLDKLNEYNKLFSYDFDIESYMNTEYLPNLKEALNARDMGLAATIVNQATLDVAPYRSQSSLLKSAQESVAEEWRDWAEKHIKAGRTSNKELKKFADDNNLELPDDKRPLSSKIKHALWERLESGGKMPKIEGLDISKLRAKDNNTTSSVNREKVYKYGTFPDYSILPKSGHSVLYTNTPTKNLDSIQEKGLLVGRNIEKYPKSPEEGMVIWTDSTNPTTSNYGGNTVAFQVPSEELKKYAVNDTQHTIPHNIRREDILFIDKMYSAEPLIKASNIMSYVEKYGKDKTISVLKNKGADEEEIRNLIDVRSAGQSESGVTKESFYKMLDETPLFQSATKDKKELVDLVAAEINGETIDAYKMGVATDAIGMGGRYPITWYRKGKPYTRFITYRNKEEQRLAEAITELFTDKQLIKQPGIISRVASLLANDFRLLTTSLDPTRAPLNFARDTGRGQITSGGQSFINPNKIFKSLLETGDYSAKEKERLSGALDNVAQMVAGETYNAAYRSGRNTAVQATKRYLSDTGANPLRRFSYSLVHNKRSIVEAPGDFFEGMTRKRLAKSAAVVRLRQLQKEGASFEKQLQGMTDAAFFAGREYTANFARKGRLIGEVSRYVAYLSSSYAGFDGIKRAFINNPEGVSKNFAVFLIAYLILLADTLGDEGSRKNYYRLSEYDRGNSIVISLGDDTVLTIPLDQEIAGFLFPYRRFMETLNGTDPVSFFEFVWGSITEPLPMDLSGFSEGGSFNLVRGLQKLTAQHMPNIASGIQEASTGYDLYYGTDISVTDETLKDYGIYDPEAGDYTTSSKNSLVLRAVANATGIPQWQLQSMVENYGGNVGSYILNILDKLHGATKDEQGGKDFVNAIFKSFVATDQDAAQSAFYDGLQQLRLEKRKLIQKIADYNEDVKTASGEAKVELQNKLQKAKDDYAVKVADFVDKYVSAYEITGGLPKSQAMQIYYLFRLDDDDTVYESGSVEEYYNNKAVQKFKNQATAMSAPILDKYYNNRIGNIYQDAEGNWRRYLSSGVQAMRNSIYGQSEEHMVGLLNILEGKDSKLKNLRTRIKDARNKAYEAKDWDTRDALGYELDKAVVDAISPYIERYGAENVLGNNEVLDYLADWFIVPDDFIKTKRGKNISLAHSGSTQEAFVRPYIKYVFGLPTNYYSYSDTSLTSPSLGEIGK